jgi:hypothetical protein
MSLCHVPNTNMNDVEKEIEKRYFELSALIADFTKDVTDETAVARYDMTCQLLTQIINVLLPEAAGLDDQIAFVAALLCDNYEEDFDYLH